VGIRVAASGGGYRAETGTSLAAPYAAAIIARSVWARASQSVDGILSTLKKTAIDLGAKDFDEVFGFGLISALDQPTRTPKIARRN
jgi:Subtilase family